MSERNSAACTYLLPSYCLSIYCLIHVTCINKCVLVRDICSTSIMWQDTTWALPAPAGIRSHDLLNRRRTLHPWATIMHAGRIKLPLDFVREICTILFSVKEPLTYLEWNTSVVVNIFMSIFQTAATTKLGDGNQLYYSTICSLATGKEENCIIKLKMVCKNCFVAWYY